MTFFGKEIFIQFGIKRKYVCFLQQNESFPYQKILQYQNEIFPYQTTIFYRQCEVSIEILQDLQLRINCRYTHCMLL